MKRPCAMTIAVLLLAGITIPGLAAQKRDDSAAEKLGFKVALQCWTLNKLSFFETVDRAAAMGIRYLETFPGQKYKSGAKEGMGPGLSDAICREILKKLSDAGGLKLVGFGVCGIPNDEAGARKLFDWAKKMGIEVIVTETTPNDVHEKLCKEYGIKVALHNHPKTWSPEQVLKACEGRCKLIGSCSDTGHWMRANRAPLDALKMLEGRVVHLHFKDLDKFGAGHDVPWGTGKADSKALLAELKRQGFKGYFSMEYEYGSLDDLAKTLPQCVVNFDKMCEDLAK